jgi:CheY-like chemotaxis protein
MDGFGGFFQTGRDIGMVSGMQSRYMKAILVIDDSSDVRLLMTSTLVRSGYSVRQAKNGCEGILMVIAQKPDLIICDVRMPGLDGYRALEAIRKCPGTAAIPFILMTGSVTRNDFRRGMVSGADDYLMKPFTSSELNAAVKSRFARQTDLQTDFFERIEKRHVEEFRQLSKELAAPINRMVSMAEAKQHQNQVARETVVPATP